MLTRPGSSLTTLLALLSVVSAGCFGKGYWTASVSTPDGVADSVARPDAVKIHLHDGSLVMLGQWRADPTVRRLRGEGTRYDIARQPVDSGDYDIPFDSIALVETHQRHTARPFGMSGLAVWTTITVPLTIVCVADPKACFGSCPTFYAEESDTERPVAEGFSASFARALEARDLDALPGLTGDGNTITIRMMNEALETHAVRLARLIAVPRYSNARVYATPDGRFFPSQDVAPPARCGAPEGDCTVAVAGFDGVERLSLADSKDLGARETIDLVFRPSEGPVGLVLAARQSLLSTFLFYQTMAYFGHSGGEWLATLERGGPEMAHVATGMARGIGGVEVLVERNGEWIPAALFDEAGPIATDVVLLPLDDITATDSLRVRLRLAQGGWRLDWVALARLEDAVDALRIEPVEALGAHGLDLEALHSLRDTTRYLVTYPGDSYGLVYPLPQSPEGYDLFLETQGYYYEWMRAEWLEETNPGLAQLALREPEAMLRWLAPAFKRVEPHMERLFWSSRVARSP